VCKTESTVYFAHGRALVITAPGPLPEPLKTAVELWVDAGALGDLNAHLDAESIQHPTFVEHVLGPDEEFHESVVGPCGPGDYGTWVKAKDGHWWSTCVPLPG
jgi:hypothetical protein